jgi:hypothetical protein
MKQLTSFCNKLVSRVHDTDMMPNYILGLLSIEEETQSLGSYLRSWVVHNFTGSRSSLTNLLESSNAILGVKVEKNNQGRLDGHDEKKTRDHIVFIE